MHAYRCLRALARHTKPRGDAISGRRPLQNLCTAASAFPSVPPDLPTSAPVPDSRAARAESLLSSGPPSNDDAELAFSLASEAAAVGCPRGLVIQGGLISRGWGGQTVDEAAARELFEESAFAGDAWGMLALGQALLEESAAVDQIHDLDSARIVLSDEGGKLVADNAPAETPAQIVRKSRKDRRAAGFEDHEGREFEAHKAAQAAEGQAGMRAAAKDWLRAAETRGLAEAALLLGKCAADERDFAEAVRCFEAVIAANKNPDAYHNLGLLLQEGAEGVEKDEKRAHKCFAMSAQLGDAAAQTVMGRALLEGQLGCETDAAAARTYIELAAAQSHGEALHLLAGLHRAGEAGLEASDGAYRRYLRMAADGGWADAMAEMADLYYKGEAGMELDNVQALEWFERAGKEGHADALCSAAAMHYHGRGTAESKHEAMLRYQQAAVMDSMTAMRNLGAMYFHGDGVPKNVTLAEQFFRLADESAAREKERVEKMVGMPIRSEEAPPHPMAEMPEEVREKLARR